MTGPRLPRVLLPVGHDLGAHYASEGASPVFQVRVGGSIVELDASEYVLWSLAHGRLDRDREWSRDDTVAAATARGLHDPDSVLDRLLEWTLIYDVALGSDESAEFGRLFRPVPLMLGLGPAVDELDIWRIGVSDEAVVGVTEAMYDLFLWAHLDESLWSACRSSAAIARRLGDREHTRTDPRLLMECFLLTAHDLLATHCMYFDIEPGLTGARRPVMDIEGGAV